MRVDDLETPCVVIDLPRVEANLKRAQDYFDAAGIALRPHIKTHKLPRFAHRQMALGATGIACQKLGEAEVMADSGLNDILIPYNLVGPAKLKRIAALARRIRLTLCADSIQTVNGYASVFMHMHEKQPVLVECDTGMGRCGVATPAEAVRLAQCIASAPGLEFAGLMTYPAAGKAAAALEWLAQAVDALHQAGLSPRIVSSGGTPDLYSAGAGRGLITEYRPGTYIYSDRFQVSRGVGGYADCALSVLATVVSRPAATRCVVDAGSKALSSDTLGLAGFGYLPDYPDARITTLSEEHGVIDFSDCPDSPEIGARLRIIPNHACVVSNLFDRVNLVAGDCGVETIAVAARGRVD